MERSEEKKKALGEIDQSNRQMAASRGSHTPLHPTTNNKSNKQNKKTMNKTTKTYDLLSPLRHVFLEKKREEEHQGDVTPSPLVLLPSFVLPVLFAFLYSKMGGSFARSVGCGQ